MVPKLIATVSILFTLIPLPLHSSELQHLPQLISEAESKNLAGHPYWLRLLHFNKTIFGADSKTSEIAQGSFFLHPDGNTDPKGELDETLLAVLSPNPDLPDLHAQCRFIARFNWLKTQLPALKNFAPEVACPKFNDWITLEKVSSISLIFVSASMKSPASMYGHALLRINFKKRYAGEELLFPTLDYGASLGGDPPIMYLFKGLIGGYQGHYGDQEFFNFDHAYGVTDLRDMWTYELNLTKNQLDKILFHVWELFAHKISFGYFFLTDNCAYRLGELIEYAWDVPKGVNSDFTLWRPTIALFNHLTKIRNNGGPLIRNIGFVPSLKTEMLQRFKGLKKDEQEWAAKLIASKEISFYGLQEQYDANDTARIVDFLLIYYRLILKERTELRELESEDVFGKEIQRKLLRFRSTLPVIRYPPYVAEKVDSNLPPTMGHPPDRIRLGVFDSSAFDNLLEIGFWSSYHDLLGPPNGHVPNGHLTTLDLRLRSDGEKFWINQLELFQVRKLFSDKTGLPALKDLAWQARAAFEQRHLGCIDCGGMSVEVGLGIVEAIRDHTIIFYMAGAAYRAEDIELKEDSLSVMPLIGFKTKFYDWQFYFEGKYRFAEKKNFIPKEDFTSSISYTIGRKWDVRLEWRDFGGQEIGFILHHYW